MSTEELAARLAVALGELRPSSRAALEHGLFVGETDGVAGVLVIQIPHSTKMPAEVTMTTGRVRLVLEP